MYCRFFVCARHAALPFGAAAPPGRSLGSLEGPNAGTCAWPDEHCAWLRDDPTQWEAALSRIGLWSSSVMGTSDASPYSHAQPTLTTSVPGRVPQLAITHQGNDLSPSVESTLHLPVRLVNTASVSNLDQEQPASQSIRMPVQFQTISAQEQSESVGPLGGSRALAAQPMEGGGLGYMESWHPSSSMASASNSPSKANAGARAQISSGPGSLWNANDLGDGEV
jgi:hypothetical protein